MKILRLDLLAFGPFTDRTLDLADGQEGLHLIHGPNEAGKSAALRALRHALYGIPVNTPDSFLHPYRSLRIGAELQSRDGRTLAFVRRKGNKNTLRGPDDEAVVDEGLLRQFVGSVDAGLFETMFGIDHAALVRGSQAIVKGDGEIGQILFAAGSGIAALRAVQRGLEADFEKLFKPGGSVPAINQSLAELEQTRRKVRDAELPGSEWVRHDSTKQKAQARKLAVVRELDEKQRARNQLDRVRQALPLIGRRLQLLADLHDVADVVLLPADFGRQRLDALTRLHLAREMEKSASEALAAAEKDLTGLCVPEDLLDQAERIEQLHLVLGSHQKAIRDRSNLVAQLGQFEADARLLLRELRPDLDLGGAEALRLKTADRVRIQNLGNAHQALVKACDEARDKTGQIGRRLQESRQDLALLAPPRDTEALRRVVRQARRQGALDEQVESARLELRQAEEQAAVEARKLSLWSGTLDELEKLPLPTAETIERFQADLKDADSVVQTRENRIAELDGELLECDRRIDQLRREQEVPTEEDLGAARGKRAEGWRLVRGAWIEGRPGGAEVEAYRAQFAPSADLAAAYEHAVERADEVADRLRREADRVAGKAKLLADRKRCLDRLAKERAAREQAESRRAQLLQDWHAVWQPVGVEPLSPREMAAWLRKQADLAQRAQAVRELGGKVASLAERRESHRREIGEQLQLLAEPGAGPGESLAALLERAETICDHIADAAGARKRLEEEVAHLQKDLPAAEKRSAEAEEELGAWQAQWREAMGRLGLPATATPAEANAVIVRVTELFAKLGEAESHRRRIEGIDADGRQFAADGRALAGHVAPDLADTPAEQAAAELNVRLTRARGAREKQQGLLGRREEERKNQDGLRRTIAETEGRLAAMCREARVDSYEDLSDAEERSGRRVRLEDDLRRVNEQLVQLAAGATLEAFLTQVQALDPDLLDPHIAQLEDEIGRLTQEKSDLDQTIGSERALLEKMDGRGDAAVAAEDVQELLAQVEAEVEQYVRLRLAAAVLRRGIDRYREKNQGPVLLRASHLFATLTAGSFQGLRVDLNDKGDPVLVGVRPGGRDTVGVEGMSEGTVDQLYLALRLASLETYLAKHEPLPFIVDDILINFDDARAVAALRALADLSRMTQVVFFTHHEHLVQLAEEYLAEGVVFTHRLEGQRGSE